jgi:hypothetical protein
MFDKFCGSDLRDGEVCLDGANRSRLGSVLTLLKNSSLLSQPPNPLTLTSQRRSKKFGVGNGRAQLPSVFWRMLQTPFICIFSKIYRTIILPVVLYGCETWSLTLREERRLRVFENRVLRRIFGRKRDEVTGNGENYIMRSLVICTPYPILCGW